MLSSLLSSTMFMLTSGSALAATILVAYLMLNGVIEVNKTKEEIRETFFPVILTLFIVFLSTVIYKLLSI
ncbi:MAG: hypothetical protein ACE5K0_08790 [Candidatus Methanofastidiosia archaeon]